MIIPWDEIWPTVRDILASAPRGTRTVDLLPDISARVGYAVNSDKLKHACKSREGVSPSALVGSAYCRTEPAPPPKQDVAASVAASAVGGQDVAANEQPPKEPEPPTIQLLGSVERHRRERNEAKQNLRHALKRVDDLEELLKTYEAYTSAPLRPVSPMAFRSGRRPAAAVALLSDVHAEERIERTEAINNEYSLEIAERRVARFFAGTTWLTKGASRDFAIDTLVLWLGGDLISGDIHDELLERCEVPPGEAMLIVRDWLASGIQSLLDAMPDVSLIVPCSMGNHGRTTKRMNASTGYGHSWEWLLYQILGHDFRSEPRVQFNASKDEMQYVSVFDYTLAFHHGHRMKYNGGIGGLTIPAIKAMHRWQQWRDADYYHFGHFHTYAPDIGSMTFNGSVIGPSPYSFAIGAAPEVPQQAFYILDAKRGKTGMHPIWVGE